MCNARAESFFCSLKPIVFRRSRCRRRGGCLGPVQTPYLSCAVPNTFSLLGRIKRQALLFPEILACLIEICRKKLIWTPYNCQKTTYYLVRHMRGTASELGLKLPNATTMATCKRKLSTFMMFFAVGASPKLRSAKV